jgi:hypothetical protein
MSEEAASKESVMPAPVETPSGLTDSMAHPEKVDASVESTAVAEVASSKDVAKVETPEVASEQIIAAPEAEAVAEKGILHSSSQYLFVAHVNSISQIWRAQTISPPLLNNNPKTNPQPP